MKLMPREIEGLLLNHAGFLAQKRLARGLRLNYPETVALIACQLQELARDGKSVSELMSIGRCMLGRAHVLPGIDHMIDQVQIEATFPDGTKLVTVHKPISSADANLDMAFYGSFLPVPNKQIFQEEKKSYNTAVDASLDVVPGEMTSSNQTIKLNANKDRIKLTVKSFCDRPIQVGSHYHFIEVNKALQFDRLAAYGRRLDIVAGTAIRFEPGDERTVSLVTIGGSRIVRGGNGICDGQVDVKHIPRIKARMEQDGFRHKTETHVFPAEPADVTGFKYLHTFGPTTGDKVRLGDTDLVIEVETDFARYGDELKFGGGKVIREGMGQAANRPCAQTLDCVITNALIVDAVTGIVKADVGIKDGLIAGIGKAGNPDIMDGVDPNLVVGAGTEAIAGEGLILTAGGLDGHVHFICPQLARDAIASGLTTMFGGGTGPASGTNATTCTPGPNNIKHMLQSTDAFPLNFGFTGKGNTSLSSGIARDLQDQITAGAMGLKLHEDWGSTPSAIDTCLRAGEKYDVQIMIHTDTLNESACVEQTVDAFKGRTIHTYHTEGAGGGHAPDIIKVCGQEHVLPSSTNPTRPFTVNTIEEHLDMLMVCHHLDPNLKEDVAFAESRIRAETIAAEDILHDMGAISMIASDSQAMGRVGEVITRTWQTADKMKRFRGRLAEEKGQNDNQRVMRYIAKYTINPAKAHGMAHLIGSVEVNKMADLVLWDPAFFGAKPEIIIKGGQIAWAQMGMPNASIPTPQPVKQRKMFGAYGKAVGPQSVVFVSQIALNNGVIESYGLSKKAEAVKNCRNITKKDMIRNSFCPLLLVDPQSYKVHILDKESKEKVEYLNCPPSRRLALAQRYFLF